MRCNIDADWLAHLVIGEDGQSIQLSFDADGLRSLVEVTRTAAAELDREQPPAAQRPRAVRA